MPLFRNVTHFILESNFSLNLALIELNFRKFLVVDALKLSLRNIDFLDIHRVIFAEDYRISEINLWIWQRFI